MSTRGALLGRIVYLFLANALSKVVRPIDWFLPGASMELLNPQNQRLENARECIRVCRCNLWCEVTVINIESVSCSDSEGQYE